MASSWFVATAETAQDIAAIFVDFQNYVEDAATEVAAIVSELYAIRAVLLECNTAVGDPRHIRRRDVIEEDKFVVLSSLDFTFKDINHLFRGLEPSTVRTRREVHRAVWRQIDTRFRAESNNSLLSRLGYYKRFIEDMIDVVVG